MGAGVVLSDCETESDDDALKGVLGSGKIGAQPGQVFSQIEARSDFVSREWDVSLLTKSWKKSSAHCTDDTGRCMYSTRGASVGDAEGGGVGSNKRMCVAGKKDGRFVGGGRIDLGF